MTRTKYGAYVIYLDDEQSKGTHCVSLFIEKNTAVYFDSFRVEYNPQKVLNKIKINPFLTTSDDSITCRLYSIAFIECMIALMTTLKTNTVKENISRDFTLKK